MSTKSTFSTLIRKVWSNKRSVNCRDKVLWKRHPPRDPSTSARVPLLQALPSTRWITSKHHDPEEASPLKRRRASLPLWISALGEQSPTVALRLTEMQSLLATRAHQHSQASTAAYFRPSKPGSSIRLPRQALWKTLSRINDRRLWPRNYSQEEDPTTKNSSSALTYILTIPSLNSNQRTILPQ